ncbi:MULTISPECIES: hypothetical protein [unclassified Rickettsia]
MTFLQRHCCVDRVFNVIPVKTGIHHSSLRGYALASTPQSRKK